MGQVKVEDIRPGMVLAAAVVIPESTTLLLKEGHALTIKGIQKIRELKIEAVEIVDRNSLFVNPIDKMTENLEQDFLLYLRKISPRQAEANKNDNMVRIADVLEGMIPRICRQETVMEFCVQLKLVDNLQLYQHSVHTAVLSGMVAGAMGQSEEEIMTAVVGGLLHDVGICEMPLVLGSKERSSQQQQLWEEHPTYGYYFAKQKEIPQEICEIILYHHERWDGSGFPKIKQGADIPLCAQIVGLCAYYDDHVTVQNMPPYIAIEEIYASGGLFFNNDVVQAFVNNIPVYPLGVMVRLSNGEVGIVANIRKNQGPRPIIKVFFNRTNRPITETKIVDLSKERTIFIEQVLE
ncbi:MAG: HD domain-containing protein [Lachnospiraceae bacterium]|nr:HD domain-containing protein [Lachnospiraceae bacterium]GFI04485.1 cyclic di-GMP phosphodiesterase [Lachnospiraceae bacterium]